MNCFEQQASLPSKEFRATVISITQKFSRGLSGPTAPAQYGILPVFNSIKQKGSQAAMIAPHAMPTATRYAANRSGSEKMSEHQAIVGFC